ncbi:MAG: hypothetical protein NVSMB3_09230 [Acidobacteriaceae bacterium]
MRRIGMARKMKQQTPGRPFLQRLGWRKVATVVAASMTVSMAYHVMFGQNGLTVYQNKRQSSRDLERQSQSLTRENELLKGHIARLQSDPNAIEHQAREELHYTRPGEVIYTLPVTPASSR